jgi:dihydrofolate reductase
MNRPTISLIVAATTGRLVIGKGLDIPWPRLAEDMAHFRKQTIPHPYISGRKTFETIKNKDGEHAPLPKRLNIVVTRNANYKTFPEVLVAHSLTEAIEMAAQTNPEKIFIGGGGQIYREALGYLPDGSHDPDKCIVDEVFLTEIDLEAEGDVTFPGIPKGLFTGGPVASQRFVQKVEDAPDIVYHITHCVRI